MKRSVFAWLSKLLKLIEKILERNEVKCMLAEACKPSNTKERQNTLSRRTTNKH